MDHDHVTAVLSAAEQGDVSAVCSLLEEGQGDVSDAEGTTPLMSAAANGRDSVLWVLLQNNADVNGRNLYGWTALMQAACYGHLPCVMLLLQSRADVRATNSWGVSALVGAAQGGFPTIVQVLLREGAEVNHSSEVACLTALMAASQGGHEGIVSQLIESGAEVNARLQTTRLTALMLAALNNYINIVNLLLKHGANKEACDINGKMAGSLAKDLGHKSIACLLSGEKPKTFTEAGLFVAIKAGDLEQVNEILDQDRGLACAQDKDGATPLMFAANKGHKEICEVLLSAGADVNVKDSVHGWTALMQATHQRKHQVAKLLGGRGADVDIRGKSGSTAFDIANMIGDVEMIRIVANITMARIQQRGPGMTTTDPTPSTRTDPPETTHPDPSASTVKPKSVEETDAPPMEKREGAAEAVKGESPIMIDMSELAKRIQHAHMSPTTPVLSIPESETSSPKPDPFISRFPRNRIRSTSHLATSPNSSLGISGSSSSSEPLPSPSFYFGDTRLSKSPGDKLLLHPANHGSALAKSGPAGRGSARNPPSSLQLKQASRNPLVSPQNSSIIAATKSSPRELPSLLLKYAGSRPRDLQPRMPILTTSRVKEQGPASLYRHSSQSEDSSPSRIRGRSNTAPTSRNISTGRMTKRPLLKLMEKPSDHDLQTVLEGESLGHCHSLFAAQEVDYHSFVTLTAKDLEELGVTSSQDRGRLMRLISRLNSRTPGEKTPGAAPHGTPTRVQSYPVFVFQ